MDRKDTNKRTADKALAHMQLIFFSEPIMKKYINRLIPGVFFFFKLGEYWRLGSEK